MRKLLLALVVVPLLAIPAGAEDYNVMMMRAINSRSFPTEPSEIRLAQSFGKCITDSTVSRLVMRRLPESTFSNERIFALAYGAPECTKEAPRQVYSPLTYRGPIAEALFEEDFPSGQPAAAHRNIRVFERPSNAELERLDPDVRAATLMVEIGECVAAANTADTRALIASEVGSDSERQAFAALAPSLSGCLPPAFELKISRFRLRGYIAEGAYRNATTGGATQ